MHFVLFIHSWSKHLGKIDFFSSKCIHHSSSNVHAYQSRSIIGVQYLCISKYIYHNSSITYAYQLGFHLYDVACGVSLYLGFLNWCDQLNYQDIISYKYYMHQEFIFYNMGVHSIKRCYKLHGFPHETKRPNNGRVRPTTHGTYQMRQSTHQKKKAPPH